EVGEIGLEAEAFLALGSALIHATKGRDEEGAAALHRSVAAAEAAGRRAVAASAHRELGYVELLRGDYVRARNWLRTAEELADGDEQELARVQALRATCLAEVSAHDQASAAFGESI